MKAIVEWVNQRWESPIRHGSDTMYGGDTIFVVDIVLTDTTSKRALAFNQAGGDIIKIIKIQEKKKLRTRAVIEWKNSEGKLKTKPDGNALFTVDIIFKERTSKKFLPLSEGDKIKIIKTRGIP